MISNKGEIMKIFFSRNKLSVIKVIFCTVTVLIVNEIGLIATFCCMHIVNGDTSPGDYKYIAQCVIKSDTFGIAYRRLQTLFLYGVWRAGE